MAFTPTEYEIINFVEQTWLESRVVPSAEAVHKYLGTARSTVAKFMDSESFRNACTARGINLYGAESKGLTAQQLMLANTLLDFADTRSHKKKLQDCGVASQTYQGWLKDPGFSAYMRTRAEALLPDALPEAHLALVDNVRRGDLGSLKLYYEMTGRWSSKTVGELNIEFFLMKVIEAVQKHVANADTVAAIADELLVLGNQALPQQPAITASNGPDKGVFDL